MTSQPPTAPSPPARSPSRRSLAVSIPAVVIALALLGSAAFIGYVVLRVEDGQIPLLAAGFVVMGAAFGAIAVWSLVGMWRAASRARGARALGLAIVGGLAGIGAIGCLAISAIAAMVWNS